MHFTPDMRLEDIPTKARGSFTRWLHFRDKPLEVRFWEKVDKGEPDACWLYKGPKLNSGYGIHKMPAPSRKNWMAHRIAWVLAKGHIPEGMFVCHTCDCKLCCNPAHLFVGTPHDNMVDKLLKRRGGYTALSDEELLEIRRLYRPRIVTIGQLAKRFQKSEATIQRAVYGHKWVKLNPEPAHKTVKY